MKTKLKNIFVHRITFEYHEPMIGLLMYLDANKVANSMRMIQIEFHYPPTSSDTEKIVHVIYMIFLCSPWKWKEFKRRVTFKYDSIRDTENRIIFD